MLMLFSKHKMPKKHRKSIMIFAVLLVSGVIIVSLARPASAAQFHDRSLLIGSSIPSETTHYIITFQYPTTSVIGSLRLKFCDNAVPSAPCNVPVGLDVSNATLSSQSGETGFTVLSQSTNEILLGRIASATSTIYASYRFDNIVNPSGENKDFYVRMSDYISEDGTGPITDDGAIAAATVPAIGVKTEVPPILVFCVANSINQTDCSDASGNYADFGELRPSASSSVTSQMLAYTNASYGYAITVSGQTMSSGVESIAALNTPTESVPGISQFGMNLRTNSNPVTGHEPSGPGTNAVISTDYDIPNRFTYKNNDVLVSSSNVTDIRKFTISYIVNVSKNQAPGVYATTLTYVCTAGF